MSDLHEAPDPEPEPQIDTVGWLFLGWLFLAFALASVTAAAAMVAYKGNDTMVANTTVRHVIVRANLFERVPRYPDRCARQTAGSKISLFDSNQMALGMLRDRPGRREAALRLLLARSWLGLILSPPPLRRHKRS